MPRVYLDHNATAPILPEVIAAVTGAMAHTGNASSTHAFGREARKMLEDARASVAALTGVRAQQVVFNAGATEGANTILSGYTDKPVWISAVEHPCILESAPHAMRCAVTKDGVLDLGTLAAQLSSGPAPALFCLQLVNSETGAVQPVAKAAALAKSYGALVLCDAVQAAGRLPIDFKSLGADYLLLSAHKFGGPQGAGALIFREGLQMPKFMKGGGQERRQRAGTENVAAIAGFGVAATLAASRLPGYAARTAALQRRLEDGLRAIAPDIVIHAAGAPRVPNTTSAALPGISAETQLMAMDLEGVAVSSGSACSSGTFKPSHVLAAMGYDDADARSALRFSTGWSTTEADIDHALAAYARMAQRMKR